MQVDANIEIDSAQANEKMRDDDGAYSVEEREIR